MGLKDTLADDLKTAMKARESDRVNCIRMLRSKLQEKEVELRGKHGPDFALDDETALQVVASYAKQRRDSIDSYRDGGREELAVAEEAELKLVAAYLPAQMGEAELRGIVEAAVAESGAGSVNEIGKVMKILMPKVKGKADGKLVNRIVRELLTR